MSELTKLLNEGYTAIDNGEFQRAYDLFYEGTRYHNNNIQCVKGLALCDFYRGKYEEAIRRFKDVLKIQPHDFNVLSCYQKAYDLIQIDLLKKPILTSEEKKLLARCYKVKEQYENAFKVLKDISSTLSAKESLDLAELTTEVFPEHFQLRKQYIEKAIKAYEKEGLNAYMPYHMLGRAYYDAYSVDELIERGTEVISIFEKSIELNKDYGHNYYLVGCILKLNDQYEESLPYYELAIEKTEGLRNNYLLGKIKSLYFTRRYHECLETIFYLNNYDYQGGNYAEALLYAGYCYYKLGEYNTAEEYAHRAAREDYDADEVEDLLDYISEGKKEREEKRREKREEKVGVLGKFLNMFNQ